MPSCNGEFSSKSKLISGLIFSVLGEVCELSWLLGMFDLIVLGVVCKLHLDGREHLGLKV